MKRITKDSAVTFVELPATQFGILDGEPSHDEYSQFRLPGRAVHALEGVLRAEGWMNVRTIIPVYHGRNGRLSQENRRRIWKSDVLGISPILRTTPQSMALAREYKRGNPDGLVVVGGPAATFGLAPWLEVADIVVMGEGERTLSELMGRLLKNESVDDVAGIALKKGKEIVVTNRRALMTAQELSRLPHPYYDWGTRAKVGLGVVETSRGCPHDCVFCSVTEFYGGKYRTKSVEYVLEELRRVQGMGRVVFYVDDNLFGNPQRSVELLEAIADRGLNKTPGTVQLTVKAADHPRYLDALRRAGIHYICLGLESMVDETLVGYGKAYTARQNREAVRTFREHGFWVHGMMMPGGDGDTPETLKAQSEWINDNLDSVELFPPTPYQGTRFHNRMKEEGRLLTSDLSLYDAQHVVFRPRNFTPLELQETIHRMYESFYSPKLMVKRLIRGARKSAGHLSSTFLIHAYVILKGFRTVLYDPQSVKHLEFLKSVS